MAFHFIEGLMGGGKSYHGAELCFTALEEGAVVHTNIPLNWEVIEARGWGDRVITLTGEPGDWVRKTTKDGKKTWASDVLQMGKEGAENVVVVDEAAIEISADTQEKDKEKNSALFGLVALSRHAGLEIYFLAQRMTHVAKKVRDLAETRTVCTNCANVPVAGWILKTFFGDLRRTIYKDGQLFGSCFLRLKPEVCEFYFTHGMRDQLEMKSGGERVKRASSWTRQSVWLIGGGLVASVAMMVWGVKHSYGVFNKHAADEKGTEKKDAKEADTKKAQRFNPDGSTKELVIQERPPAPKGGILLEWDAYDEHVLAGVLTGSGKKTVLTRGGRRLSAGGSYEGQRIELQFEVAGWHYFQCVNKRLIVVRPIRPEEREALPPVTIPGPKSNLPVDVPLNESSGMLAGFSTPTL